VGQVTLATSRRNAAKHEKLLGRAVTTEGKQLLVHSGQGGNVVTAPTDDRRTAAPTADSGAYGQPEPGAYPEPPVANRGRSFTIASVVCSVIALIFLPIILGPLGIIFGFVGHARGDRYGKWAGIFGIVATVVGMLLSYIVLKNMRS
jgi:hypothetical protein